MKKEQLLRKISILDREITYYKKVYSRNTNKILELIKQKKSYSRILKKLAQ